MHEFSGFSRASLTAPAAIKTGVVLLLSLLVSRFGKPWLAAVLLSAVLVAFDIRDHVGFVPVLVRALIFLVLAGSIFWLIERAESLVLAAIIGLTTAAVLIYLV
ncbi:MAG: hypothetical protein ABI613_04890 [Gemmatimonadota bacterium]